LTDLLFPALNGAVQLETNSGPAPARLLYRPASFFERLEVADLFQRLVPLEVELGCGDSSFLVEWAHRHPEHNFLGVERLLGRLRKLDRKGRRLGLRNLRGLRLEAGYALEFLLPLTGVSALHIYFPDPWPKRKHWSRRLVNQRFPALAARVLVPGGTVYLRTDDASYFQQMTEVFGQSAAFCPVATPAELAVLLTDFERDFLAQGKSTWRAAYSLVR
jgi:tRNA (guanine-N7-)-methyltransferase